MEIKIVKIENPDNLNLILGQSHFIKTVEDIYEAMVSTVPMAKFGLAFCEASDVCLVRYTGTDKEMLDLAQKKCLYPFSRSQFYYFHERYVSRECLKRDQKRTGSMSHFLCHSQSCGSHHC